MRSVLIAVAVAVVGAAIGVSTAVGTSSGPVVPAVVDRAIANTLDVKSVEIFQNLPNANGPAIYQAPDRFEGPYSIGSSSLLRAVIIGDSEFYVAATGRRGEGNAVPSFLRPPSTLHSQNGRTPAQQAAFLPLIDAQRGTNYHRVQGQWAFSYHFTRSDVTVIGGDLTLSGGRVVEASITETEAGRKIRTSWRYERFDDAPSISISVGTARSYLSARSYLTRFARQLAAGEGDPSVHSAVVYLTTREQAAGGDVVNSNQPVYELVIRGRFVCNACSRPPGAPAPRGTVLTYTFDRATLKETDFGLANKLVPALPHANSFVVRF